MAKKQFSRWQPTAIWNFIFFHNWSRDCHWVANMVLCTIFYQYHMIWRFHDFQDGGCQPSWIFIGPIMSSLKSPCRTSYRLSIDIIALDCLVFFRKSRLYVWILATDKQTDKQMVSERRFNDIIQWSRQRALISCFLDVVYFTLSVG